MLRYAASFVTAAYSKVRLIPQDLRALPMDFLRNRLVFKEIEFMNGIGHHIYSSQMAFGKTKAQDVHGSEKDDAKTAAKQVETVFLNELLRIMMEHTSFGQDRTVSTFLPVITSEMSKSLAVRGIGIEDFLMKNPSSLTTIDREHGDSGHKNKVIFRPGTPG